MTTRSQKRKAIEELVSTEMETPIPETNQNLNPVAGTSKSPRVITENLEEIKSSLRKEIMSDLTKILAENQKEMLKLIAAPVKKQTVIATTEETDSESENIPENATPTPIKNKTTATNRKTTPINSRNTDLFCSDYPYLFWRHTFRKLMAIIFAVQAKSKKMHRGTAIFSYTVTTENGQRWTFPGEKKRLLLTKNITKIPFCDFIAKNFRFKKIAQSGNYPKV